MRPSQAGKMSMRHEPVESFAWRNNLSMLLTREQALALILRRFKPRPTEERANAMKPSTQPKHDE